MAADTEIRGVLLLLHGLMMSACILEGVLLRAAVLVQDAVARFKLIPDSRDVLVHDSKLGVLPGQLLPGHPACFRTAESGAGHFGAFFRETDAAGADRGHLRFEIWGWGNLRLQFPQFLQKLAVGSVVILEPSLHAR